MCLSKETIILFHKNAIEQFGGDDGIRSYEDIASLSEYVMMTGERYEWDQIECICLAVYQIVKGHYFVDANKRTAHYVLINCLRKCGYRYTGRPKDLVNQIIELARSQASDKQNAVLTLSYFLKRHLQ